MPGPCDTFPAQDAAGQRLKFEVERLENRRLLAGTSA